MNEQGPPESPFSMGPAVGKGFVASFSISYQRGGGVVKVKVAAAVAAGTSGYS